MKNPEKVKQGKNNRAKGKSFELKVRADLEKKGWIVDRWTNNVEFTEEETACDSTGKLCSEEEIIKSSRFMEPIICTKKIMRGKLVTAKSKYNPFTKAMMMGSGGFPDFMAFRLMKGMKDICGNSDGFARTTVFDLSQFGWYEVIGVECKTGKYLSREEKTKCQWLLENKKFSKILIASKGKKRGEIVYEEFKTE